MTIIFPYFTCLKLFAICCCITDKSKYQGMKGSFFSVPTSPNSSIGHSPPAFRSSPIGIHTTYNSPDTECYFLSLSLHCLFYLECPLPMMINLVNSSVSYKTQLREPFCDTPHKYNWWLSPWVSCACFPIPSPDLIYLLSLTIFNLYPNPLYLTLFLINNSYSIHVGLNNEPNKHPSK